MHSLIGHIEAIHEGNKPFKCDICDAEFGHKHHLNTHVVTVHEGKKQWKCDICNTAFGRKHHLNTHSLGRDSKSKKSICYWDPQNPKI